MDTATASSERLYRILDFHRVVEIFQKREIYFARPTTWADPYEHHDTRLSASVFAQCWCQIGVSDAMWRIYSPNGLGVRVSTSRSKLERVLDAFEESRDGCKVLYKPVAYYPQSKLQRVLGNLQKLDKETDLFSLEPLFRKRNAFSHESEWRAAIFCPNGPEKKEEGLRVPVDPHDLFNEILLDPRAPAELVDAFKFYFEEKLKFPKRVARSQLYKLPTRPLVET